MFANSYQSGFISIFYSVGSNPLALWDSQVKNGHIRRIIDEEVKSLVLEISGTNVATTYITSPIKPRASLGIRLPFLVMIIKNMKKYFTFEIQILDDKDMHRRFRVSNFQSSTKVRPFCTTMPIGLSSGWNQVQFNLADFTKRAYGSTYMETMRVQIHANVRIRRLYFTDTLYTDDELPNEFKLFGPMQKKKDEKKPSKEQIKEEEEKQPEEPPPPSPVDLMGAEDGTFEERVSEPVAEEKLAGEADEMPAEGDIIPQEEAGEPRPEEEALDEEAKPEGEAGEALLEGEVPAEGPEPAEGDVLAESEAAPLTEGETTAELLAEGEAAPEGEAIVEDAGAPEGEAAPEGQAEPEVAAELEAAVSAADQETVAASTDEAFTELEGATTEGGETITETATEATTEVTTDEPATTTDEPPTDTENPPE